MDFFSERELVTQTGHEIGEWPLVFLKETIDNAMDACEEAGIPPIIEIAADAAGITVRDNGPGLPGETLKAALDFTVRASNREAYISPCRGAQGNALKTILPMPRIIDADHGRLIVSAHGKRHVITCGACPISQRAVPHDDVTEVPKSKKRASGRNGKASFFSGTEMRIEWGPRDDDYGVVWPFDELNPQSGDFPERFRMMVEGFAIFNPHAAIRLDWFGESREWKATNPAWEKWRPDKPTSPHWYEPRHLERLIGAYIVHGRDHGTDRLVSEFLAEFDGLSGSRNRAKVLEDAGMLRAKLSELVAGGRLDSDRIGRLLSAMQRCTRPVKPQRLGFIGEDHLKARLLAMGVQPDSFTYKRRLPPKSKNRASSPDEKACFVPWVLESAFGWLGPAANDRRRIYSGANWSAAIKNPFRSFGTTGEGLEATLTEMRAGRNEPIVFVLHLAHPRVEYTDRGKSALIVEGGS
ncbi:MAG: hypothetical protein KY475_17610 [Planctomycetes bacterium]|nr:hypothetical protein [Planctomycetota bacterium]